MSFNINNKLAFIDSFQFFSFSLFSLDSLAKNFGKGNFKYLSQEFDSNILYLFKQKVFYSYEHMNRFKKLKDELPNREKI